MRIYCSRNSLIALATTTGIIAGALINAAMQNTIKTPHSKVAGLGALIGGLLGTGIASCCINRKPINKPLKEANLTLSEVPPSVLAETSIELF